MNIINTLGHPIDREWLAYGLMCLGIWLWVLIQSLLTGGGAPKFLKKYPSQASVITSVFDLIAAKRFSFIGKLTYILGFLWCLSMIGMAYLTDTLYDHLSFEIFLGISFAYLAIAGLHVAVNRQLIACLRILNELKDGPVEAYGFHEALKGEFSFLAIGVLMICVAAFLFMCWTLNFPMSIYDLAAIANRS